MLLIFQYTYVTDSTENATFRIENSDVHVFWIRRSLMHTCFVFVNHWSTNESRETLKWFCFCTSLNLFQNRDRLRDTLAKSKENLKYVRKRFWNIETDSEIRPRNRERIWNTCERDSKILRETLKCVCGFKKDSEMRAQNHERLSNTCKIDSEISTETLKPPKNREITPLLATNCR